VRGRLIVFEGAEGAGKTTQLALLADDLRNRGRAVMQLREPGGTPLGDAIRQLLLDPSRHVVPEAEALLFMASRAQIVREEIDPALDRGVVVVMDRFFLSTYAYQVYGRGLDESRIVAANSLATGGLVPDLTIILGIPVAEGLARVSRRGEHDRIEQASDDFHSRVERAFSVFASGDWQAAHPECGRITVVDGRGTPGEVHERVMKAVDSLPGMLA
jgi:dTMP kinase